MNFHDISSWEQNQLGPFDPRSGCRHLFTLDAGSSSSSSDPSSPQSSSSSSYKPARSARPAKSKSKGIGNDAFNVPAHRLFFEEALRRALKHRQLMVYDSDVAYPPIAVLASDNGEMLGKSGESKSGEMSGGGGNETTVTTWRRPTPTSPFCFDEDDERCPPLKAEGEIKVSMSNSWRRRRRDQTSASITRNS